MNKNIVPFALYFALACEITALQAMNTSPAPSVVQREKKAAQAGDKEIEATTADIKKRAIAEFGKFFDILSPMEQEKVPQKTLEFMQLLSSLSLEDSQNNSQFINKHALLSCFIEVINHEKATLVEEAPDWEKRTVVYKNARGLIYPAGHEAFKKAEPTGSNIVEKMVEEVITKTTIMTKGGERAVYTTIPDIMEKIESILKNGDKANLSKYARRGSGRDYETRQAVETLLLGDSSSLWDKAREYYLAREKAESDLSAIKADWHTTAYPLMDLYCEIYRVYNTYYAKGNELPAEQFDPEIMKKRIGWLSMKKSILKQDSAGSDHKTQSGQITN